MARVQEVVQEVSDLLAGNISLDEFEDWFAFYSWNIHQQADVQARDLVYEIRGLLNTHAEDESEDALRLELANAIRPFEATRVIRWERPGSISALTQTCVSAKQTKRMRRNSKRGVLLPSRIASVNLDLLLVRAV